MQLQKLEVQAFLSSHRSILPSLQTIELPDSVFSTTKDLWNRVFLSIAPILLQSGPLWFPRLHASSTWLHQHFPQEVKLVLAAYARLFGSLITSSLMHPHPC